MPDRRWDTDVWVADPTEIRASIGWKAGVQLEDGLRDVREVADVRPGVRDRYETTRSPTTVKTKLTPRRRDATLHSCSDPAIRRTSWSSRSAHTSATSARRSRSPTSSGRVLGDRASQDPADPDRDRFVLSKGHAALALYAALAEIGVSDRLTISTPTAATRASSACTPSMLLTGVDFSTGSLGQGLSMAVGAALAARMQGSDATCLRDRQRCRVQRGLGVGGRDVRRPTPLANLTCCRPQSPAGVRLHARRSCELTTCPPAGEHSAGTSSRPTATTKPSSSGSSTSPAGRPAARRCRRDRLRQGRLVHGAPDQVALPADVAIANTSRRMREIGRASVRSAFVQALVEAAERDDRIVLLTGDLGFMALEPFRDRFPDRFFNMGVAEQNMVGVATGLAEAGFMPFCYSIVPFAVAPSLRVHPQRSGAARSAGHESSVWAAASSTAPPARRTTASRTSASCGCCRTWRSIAPADGAQAATAVDALSSWPGPAYLRLGKNDQRSGPRARRPVRAGPGAAGPRRATTSSCSRWAASPHRSWRPPTSSHAEGISAAVVVVASVSPVPTDDLVALVSAHSRAVTIEAHVINGGIGSLVAEVIAESGASCRLVRMGIDHPYGGARR